VYYIFGCTTLFVTIFLREKQRNSENFRVKATHIQNQSWKQGWLSDTWQRDKYGEQPRMCA
jgi:hypothetical protein